MKHVLFTLAILFCYAVFLLVVVGFTLLLGTAAFAILDGILRLI